MKSKKMLFLSFLHYDWWKILGVFGVLSAILAFSFNYKDKLKENEILEIFVSFETKDLSFQKDLYSMVGQNEVKAIHCTSSLEGNDGYNQMASSYISSVADIYLLPESVLASHASYASYAKDIEDENSSRFQEISSSISFYQGEYQKPRGIKIYDLQDVSYNEGKKFSSWFELKETTYLFVSDVSTNRLSVDKKGRNLLWEFAYAFLELGVSSS